MPLLLALDKPNLKQQLLPLLNKKRQMTLTNMQAVQRIIVNSSVMSESQDLAKQYVHQAVDCLNILKPNPAVRLLKQLPNKLLTRNF